MSMCFVIRLLFVSFVAWVTSDLPRLATVEDNKPSARGELPESGLLGLRERGHIYRKEWKTERRR